jgi:hypothetical protein
MTTMDDGGRSDYLDALTKDIARTVSARWPGRNIGVQVHADVSRVRISVTGRSTTDIQLPPVRECCQPHCVIDVLKLTEYLTDRLEEYDLIEEEEI